MKRQAATVGAVLVLLCAAAAAPAQTVLTQQISGNTLSAKIQLPGGIAADLSIVFEQAVGLNTKALSLSAGLVNPSDAALLSRLPVLGVTIPAAFPVLLRIIPTSTSALSFSGVYALSLYTHNLTLITNSPLRLYRAAATGGAFQDMTGFLQLGSVRAGGSGPGFSEFLIVADVRPTDAIIQAKFDALQAVLTSNASSITPSVLQDLQARLNSAESFYTSGNFASAIDSVAGFGDKVKQQSGANIPDVWRARSTIVNVAGLLRSAADTLKFSLSAKANGAP